MIRDYSGHFPSHVLWRRLMSCRSAHAPAGVPQLPPWLWALTEAQASRALRDDLEPPNECPVCAQLGRRCELVTEPLMVT